LIQNRNWKLKDAAKEAAIELAAAYKFHKQWKTEEGNMLPGYVHVSKLKTKQNNLKLTDEHSQLIESYVEGHPTCIVKNATHELCEAFEGLKINQSTVYRHIIQKLSFTLTHT
ncbi:hypothetical protein BDA99DRAFT_433009, partial [Phascolomyces articulosus]